MNNSESVEVILKGGCDVVGSVLYIIILVW